MHLPLRFSVLCFSGAAFALAQQQPIIDRAGQGTPTPAVPPAGETAPAAPVRLADEDAGVQRVAEPRRLPFRVSASIDEQLYVTNNVFLAPDGEADAGADATILASTFFLQIEGLPSAVGTGLLTPSAGFAYQRYLHGLTTHDAAIEDLDFDSFSFPLGVSYRFGRGWEAAAGFSIGSLYSARGEPDYELIYRSRTATLGLRKVTELAKNTVLVAGGGIGYSDTWTSLRDVPAPLGYRDDRNDRIDISADAALYRFSGAWTLSPFVRALLADYAHWQEGAFADHDRRDLTLAAGFSASLAFESWGSLRFFVGYDLRDSNLDGGSGPDYTYDAGTLGGGLTFRLRY